MTKYKVIIHPDAETDIESSFEWGCQTWGRENAQAWVRQLYQTIRNRLTSVPHRCPIAPEGDELDRPIRHLMVGRYRILFVVEKKTVTIIHVRGSYVAQLLGRENVE
jgi:toxin ParE1/3/4